MIESKAVKRAVKHAFLVGLAGIGLVAGPLDSVAQGAKSLPPETFDIGDEPGRP